MENRLSLFRLPRFAPRLFLTILQKVKIGGHDVRKLEPKYQVKRLTIWTLDPIIQELRAIFKIHPEWFEVPKPKSDKGRNVVDYSI